MTTIPSPPDGLEDPGPDGPTDRSDGPQPLPTEKEVEESQQPVVEEPDNDESEQGHTEE